MSDKQQELFNQSCKIQIMPLVIYGHRAGDTHAHTHTHTHFNYNVSNIYDHVRILFCRQYEEKQLKSQQERAKKKLALTNQESRLQNQVCHLQSHAIYDFACVIFPIVGL